MRSAVKHPCFSTFLVRPIIVMLSDGFLHDRVSDFEVELAEKENIMSERLNNVQQNDNRRREMQGSDSETGSCYCLPIQTVCHLICSNSM